MQQTRGNYASEKTQSSIRGKKSPKASLKMSSERKLEKGLMKRVIKSIKSQNQENTEFLFSTETSERNNNCYLDKKKGAENKNKILN